MIKGINHLTFSVSSLETSIAFYQQVFDAELLFCGGETAYLDLAGLWLALNIQADLLHRETAQSYTHIAFTIDAVDIPKMEQRLQQLGILLLPGRTRSAGEGLSLYFADPDGHLLEVHTGDCKTRIETYQADEILFIAEE